MRNPEVGGSNPPLAITMNALKRILMNFWVKYCHNQNLRSVYDYNYCYAHELDKLLTFEERWQLRNFTDLEKMVYINLKNVDENEIIHWGQKAIANIKSKDTNKQISGAGQLSALDETACYFWPFIDGYVRRHNLEKAIEKKYGEILNLAKKDKRIYTKLDLARNNLRKRFEIKNIAFWTIEDYFTEKGLITSKLKVT